MLPKVWINDMTFRNPTPTVDIIIELRDRPHRPIILIERQNAPFGWAIPGGFVDYGESVELAARREAKEEVSLDVELVEQFYVYSDPNRDPRQHTLSVVFIATAKGEPKAADDAKNIEIFIFGICLKIFVSIMTKFSKIIGIIDITMLVRIL